MNIAIIGYGRMGKTIEKIAIDRGHTIGLKIDLNNQDELNPQSLKDIDVAIEFTTPATALSNVSRCLQASCPIISGTTAWNDKHEEAIALCKAENGALLISSNFSVGMNVFFAINKRLAEMMKTHNSYHLGMSEIHHTAKLDAPSGTAITLAEGIIESNPSKESWINEKTELENTIGIESIREPDVPGTHIINYGSDIDAIEIKHTAYNRIGFATGAVIAAEWIADKTGIYSMTDVLDL